MIQPLLFKIQILKISQNTVAKKRVNSGNPVLASRQDFSHVGQERNLTVLVFASTIPKTQHQPYELAICEPQVVISHINQ